MVIIIIKKSKKTRRRRRKQQIMWLSTVNDINWIYDYVTCLWKTKGLVFCSNCIWDFFFFFVHPYNTIKRLLDVVVEYGRGKDLCLLVQSLSVPFDVKSDENEPIAAAKVPHPILHSLEYLYTLDAAHRIKVVRIHVNRWLHTNGDSKLKTHESRTNVILNNMSHERRSSTGWQALKQV